MAILILLIVMMNTCHLSKKYYGLSALLLSMTAAANTPPPPPQTPNWIDDRRLQSEYQAVPLPVKVIPTAQAPQVVNQGGAVEMSERELIKNPELLSRAMLSALVYNNADNVAILLPLYRKLTAPNFDADMQLWAMATINVGEGDYVEAVRKYQILHKKYPTNPMFAVRLGQAYFGNKQYKEAEKLFLAQPADIQAELTPYLQYIKQLKKVNFSATGNYLADKNINNAPSNRELEGGWLAPEAESANGFYLYTSAGKRIFLNNGKSLYPEATFIAKHYWNAKHYNEQALRVSLGMTKQNANYSVTVSPFTERTDYAGGSKGDEKLKHFSDSTGVAIEVSKPINKKAQLTVASEVAKNRYTDRKHLDGYTVSVSPAVNFYPKWLGNGVASVGTDYTYTSTQDKDDSYRRWGVRGTVAKEWQNIGARVGVGVARREYLAPMPIFNKVQENDEYFANVSLWHKRLAYKNFVPRLTWQYQKTDSTVQLYSYDKNRVFVEIGGGF